MIKMQTATAVGKMIDDVFKAADDTGKLLHEAAIQCVLHIQDHGDTGMLARLVKGGEERALNMRGLKFWLGHYFPITVRGDNWSLIKTDSDTYAKLVERNIGKLEPVEGPGGRLFWIDEADANPFWSLGEVQKDNARQITRLTTATVMGQLAGITKRLDAAINSGKFVGDTKLADKLADVVTDTIANFTKEHKAELRAERLLAAEAAEQDAEPEEVTEQIPGAVQPKVGGLKTSEDDAQQVKAA